MAARSGEKRSLNDNRETVHHPIFARVFERFVAARDGEEIRARRQRLLAGLTGRVLEVGRARG